jgi:hypothetical protein
MPNLRLLKKSMAEIAKSIEFHKSYRLSKSGDFATDEIPGPVIA